MPEAIVTDEAVMAEEVAVDEDIYQTEKAVESPPR
jgi:hypothetical protein